MGTKLLMHVAQFELCLLLNRHSAREVIFAYYSYCNYQWYYYFILGARTTCDFPRPCSMFVCPRGAHRSLLWCTRCIQVVESGGRVTFVHQSYVGIIVAPWDDGVLGQTFLSQESTCLSYKRFAQCLPRARLLSQVHPEGQYGGAPADSYEGCPQASRALPESAQDEEEREQPHCRDPRGRSLPPEWKYQKS